MKKIAEKLNITGQTFEELCDNQMIKDHMVKQFEAKKKEQKLKGFERLVKVYISKEPFEKLGLLTTTFKLKRHLAKEQFIDELNKMYEGLN